MKPLQPTLAAAWVAFADAANWSDFHTLDLNRFATFTSVAHHPARRKDPIDFKSLLRKHNPAWNDDEISEMATELQNLYDFGRRVLRAYTHSA